MNRKDGIPLREIARTFFLIGLTSFGGAMAIVAYIQEIVVTRRKWLSLEEFSHGVAFGQILGPFSVNTAVFVGYRLRGLAGGLTALAAFLAPSIAIVIALSSLYFRYGQLPSLKSALNGISPVIVALMVGAAYEMGRTRIRSFETVAIAVGALLILLLVKIPTIWVLLLAGAYGVVRLRLSLRRGAGHEA